MRYPGILVFRSMILGTLALPCSAMQDTSALRQNNYNTITQILSAISGGSTNLTAEIESIQHGATDLDTAIGNVENLIGATGTATSDIFTQLGTPARTDFVTTIGGTSGSSLSARLGDPGNGNSLIGNLRTGGSILQTEIGALNTILGGTGTTNTRAATILDSLLSTSHTNVTSDIATLDATLLASPTGNLQTDLATARGQLVSALGTTLQADISAVGAGLLTTPTGNLQADLMTARGQLVSSLGATLQADINTVGAGLLTTPTGNLQADLMTARGQLVSALGTTLQADISAVGAGLLTTPSGIVQADVQSINSLLNGTATGSTTQSRVNSVNSALGSAGSTLDRTNNANVLLDGVQNLTGLSSFTVSTAAANSSGTVSIIGNDGSASQTYDLTYSSPIVSEASFPLTHSGNGNTITFVNNSGGSLSSAAALASYLATAYPVSAVIKRNTNTKATALMSLIGGSANNVMGNMIALDASLLSSPTGALTADLATARGSLVTSPGLTLQDDIQSINSLLNGTASGTTSQTRIGTPTVNGSGSNLSSIIGGSGIDIASQLGDPGANFSSLNAMIGDGGVGSIVTSLGNSAGTTSIVSLISNTPSSVQVALNSLSTMLVNNAAFSTPLSTQVTTLSTILDNTLSSLPGSSTYATIGTGATSDGSGGVNIVISGGLGSANGTYNLSATDITNSISNGSTITFINGSNNLTLINRSGTNISSQTQAINYLASLYPAGSQISMGVSDKISNGLNKLVGGTASSVRARLANVDASLLSTPTGVLATDIATARNILITSPGSTLQADIESINSLLNGTASGSTSQERIGTPTVNGVGSNLSSVIGGAGSDVASQLGDPISGTSGLSSLISNNGTSLGTVNGVDCSGFDNATDYYSQLNQFMTLVNAFSSASTTQVQIPKGTYTSLRELLAAMNYS